MEMDAGNLLLIAVICVVIGFLAGILVSNLRRDKDDPEARLGALLGSAEKTPGSPQTAGETSWVETARLIRDHAQSPLKVMIGGKVFPKASDLSSPQRDEMEEVMVELLGWLGYNPALRRGTVQPAPVKPPGTGPLSASIDLSKVLSPSPSAAVKDQPKGMVAQINDILQEKLSGTELESRGVRLIDSLSDGVMVQIGLETYHGIEEVPDEEIKKMIRGAVTTWEKRNQ